MSREIAADAEMILQEMSLQEMKAQAFSGGAANQHASATSSLPALDLRNK